MPKPRPRSCLKSLESLSCGQPRVCEADTGRCCDEALQPGHCVNLHIAIVQTEGELIHIAAQMLCAGMMVDAVDTTLHDGPDALHAVCGDALTGILTRAVIDNLVDVVVT